MIFVVIWLGCLIWLKIYLFGWEYNVKRGFTYLTENLTENLTGNLTGEWLTSIGNSCAVVHEVLTLRSEVWLSRGVPSIDCAYERVWLRAGENVIVCGRRWVCVCVGGWEKVRVCERRRERRRERGGVWERMCVGVRVRACACVGERVWESVCKEMGR